MRRTRAVRAVPRQPRPRTSRGGSRTTVDARASTRAHAVRGRRAGAGCGRPWPMSMRAQRVVDRRVDVRSCWCARTHASAERRPAGRGTRRSRRERRDAACRCRPAVLRTLERAARASTAWCRSPQHDGAARARRATPVTGVLRMQQLIRPACVARAEPPVSQVVDARCDEARGGPAQHDPERPADCRRGDHATTAERRGASTPAPVHLRAHRGRAPPTARHGERTIARARAAARRCSTPTATSATGRSTSGP